MLTHFKNSLFVFALVAGLATVASANTIYTLPDNWRVSDIGTSMGMDYVSGRVNGVGVNPLIFNLTTSIAPIISIGRLQGQNAVSATVVAIDRVTNSATLSIDFGVGLGSRSGKVSLNGGTVTLDKTSSNNVSGSVEVRAAASGINYGADIDGRPAYSVNGAVWTFIVDTLGYFSDAVSGAFGSRAAANLANADGGFDTVIYTNLAMSTFSGCGPVICAFASFSSDGQFGAQQYGTQAAFLDFNTNNRVVVPVENSFARGVKGGANPVIFFSTAVGSFAMTIGNGKIETQNEWFERTSGLALPFLALDSGHLRFKDGFNDNQIVYGSNHIVTIQVNPSGGNAAVPEPTTIAMIGSGLIGLGYFARRRATA